MLLFASYLARKGFCMPLESQSHGDEICQKLFLLLHKRRRILLTTHLYFLQTGTKKYICAAQRIFSGDGSNLIPLWIPSWKRHKVLFLLKKVNGARFFSSPFHIIFDAWQWRKSSWFSTNSALKTGKRAQS